MYYAFISDGKLFVRFEDGKISEINSKFAKEKMEDTQKAKDLHSWKSEVQSDSPYYSQNIIWGGQASTRPFRIFRFMSVIAGGQDTLYYLITNDFVTGLFRYNIIDDEELRLFHEKEFHNIGISYSKKENKFVAARIMEDGSSDLELLDSNGHSIKFITEGDSRDSYPSFSSYNHNEVLYQVAGISRDEAGFVVAYGPEAIYKINIETGEIKELLQDDRYDYLLPREDCEGNLYCIRRPYTLPGYISPVKSMLNMLTFPFRFVIAIFRFLEAFTKLFTEKPFKPAGPQAANGIENKYVRILGQTISLAKIRKKLAFRHEPSLVPGSWKLIKITKDGDMKVIAHNVSSYDIDKSGQLYITNGFRISKISEGKISVMCKHKLIENLQVG